MTNTAIKDDPFVRPCGRLALVGNMSGSPARRVMMALTAATDTTMGAKTGEGAGANRPVGQKNPPPLPSDGYGSEKHSPERYGPENPPPPPLDRYGPDRYGPEEHSPERYGSENSRNAKRLPEKYRREERLPEDPSSVLPGFSAFRTSVRSSPHPPPPSPPVAMFVGGCVRDAALGRVAHDIDIATSLPPDRMARALADAGIRTVATGLEHGTLTALSGDGSFEVTSLRRDVETFGRHAKVAFGADWIEDAARRDFTINALYSSMDGDLFDPWGGLGDLATGKIRFIGKAEDRIREDYLRVLRFFRFQSRFGRLPMDRVALAACCRFAAALGTLSKERVRSELLRLLAQDNAGTVIATMLRGGIFRAILPGRLSAQRLQRMIAVERAWRRSLDMAGFPRTGIGANGDDGSVIRRLAAFIDGNAGPALSGTTPMKADRPPASASPRAPRVNNGLNNMPNNGPNKGPNNPPAKRPEKDDAPKAPKAPGGQDCPDGPDCPDCPDWKNQLRLSRREHDRLVPLLGFFSHDPQNAHQSEKESLARMVYRAMHPAPAPAPAPEPVTGSGGAEKKQSPDVRELLYRLGREKARDAVLFYISRNNAFIDWPMIARLVETVDIPVFPLKGRDLRAAGHSAGPRMGQLLTKIEAYWIAHGYPDKAVLLAQAARRH